MMFTKKKRALLMIFLIITIPFISASALAELNIIYAGGEGASDGYIGSEDRLVINVTATQSVIKFPEAPNTPYIGVLNPSTGLYSFNLVDGEETSYYEESFEFELVGYDTSNNPVVGSSDTARVVVDNTAPVVSFSVEQSISDKKPYITITSAQDPENLYGECSGVRSIKVVSSSQVIQTLDVETSFGNCQEIASFTRELSLASSGTYRLSVLIEDNTGNTYETQAQRFDYDDDAPIATSSLFEMYYHGTKRPVSALSTRNVVDILVDVYFRIRDPNLDVSSVEADLRSLNANTFTDMPYSEIPFDCVESGTASVYDCTSAPTTNFPSGLPLSIIASGSGNIVLDATVSASDYFGYSNNDISLSKTIIIDNNKPRAQSIGTGYCKQSTCYVSSDANIIVMRTEGIGTKTLNNRGVTLYVGRLSTNQVLVPYECSGIGGSVWECKYFVSTSSNLNEGESVDVYLTSPSYDDLGNPFEDFSDTVVVDSIAPADVEAKFFSKASNAPYLLEGDNVRVVLTASDATSGVRAATLDFSSVDESKSEVFTTCEEISGSEYECVWNTGLVAWTPGNHDVDFVVEDYAGNKARYTSSLEILVNADYAADFWSFESVTITPSTGVDVVTLPYFPSDYAQVWVSPTLDGDPYARILSVDFLTSTKCVLSEEDQEEFENVLRTAKVFRKTYAYTDGSNLLIEVELIKEQLGIAANEILENEDINQGDNFTLTYTCPLSIVSAKQGRLFPAQNLNLTFSIPVFSSQYMAGHALQKKIDDKKESLRKDKIIDELNDYMEMLQEICGFWNAAVTAYKGINILMGVTATALEAVGITWSIGKGLQAADWGVAIGLDKVAVLMGYLCGFAQCTLWPNFIEKTVIDTGGMETGKRIVFQLMLGYTDEEGLGKLVGELNGGYYETSKKSILYSIIFLCIPGLIYNLKQSRNIDCQYVYCLETEVSENGMQPYACDARKAYAKCLFVYGQVFNSLPFSQVLNAFSNLIRLFADNPLSALGGVLTVACSGWFGMPGWLESTCINVNMVTDAIDTVRGIGDFFDYLKGDRPDPARDYCEEIGVN
ncbi:hypothetical protein GOV05_03690 [Candidatus Woesearchaeota archaeon]|nr:hypothetical protein [Candidatus Woesearchaeota archaeon]